ncbi:MAG: alpha/beta hydrolase [Tissierellaceae bacterium]|nr:alpha/beta hydrolase [Tissierellaceae bacterium]
MAFKFVMKGMKKTNIIKRIGIVFFVLLVGALTAGYIYQMMSVKKDEKLYKPPGTLYKVGNKKMHLYEGGSGDATVVFAAGWGTVNPYVDFYPLYGNISKFAKFIVYDKFGYGYSDTTDKKREIDVIVDEIHEILTVSGQKPPYIFVGHSLASLEIIRYSQLYKNEVKGIVLIDGGNPELYAKTKPITFISTFQRQLINFGIARVLYKTNGFADYVNSQRNGLRLLPSELKKLDETATLLKGNNENIIDEMKKSQENAEKVVNAGKLQDIPLTIITSGDFGNVSKEWLDSQKKMMEWSNNSRQFVVKDSKHYIHQYHPEIIADEIINIINKK